MELPVNLRKFERTQEHGLMRMTTEEKKEAKRER